VLAHGLNPRPKKFLYSHAIDHPKSLSASGLYIIFYSFPYYLLEVCTNNLGAKQTALYASDAKNPAVT
jgi:hypothetical protein